MAGSNRRGRGGGAGGLPNATIKITIGSDLAASRDVQRRILEHVARYKFNHQCTFAIKLALEEGLNNAIRHGNRLDPSKKVHVEARVTATEVEIVIEDEGSGFDRGVIPDPTLAENLEKTSGRGILLIEAYMNEVKWSRGGRRLRMIKRNEADCPETCP
ncbi:MAG: ATP-binding protein [Planctomycetota bacterium]|nr:ATP-binding protein [Planctomycetota bacterium]